MAHLKTYCFKYVDRVWVKEHINEQVVLLHLLTGKEFFRKGGWL